jgi:SAM-dependent methyltransferase
MSEVVYLSASMPVHMADEWFAIANRDHFWIRRRFDVLQKLARGIEFRGKQIGEIGCGSGLVQQQFQQRYQTNVDGFDLNEHALKNSVATNQPRYCYNIFDRNPGFRERYDVVLLFDVLEHIEDEKPFLEAVLFHLKKGGFLFINVPAFMAFHSRYDEVVGHQRRYDLDMLDKACSSVALKKVTSTYWGLPMVPLLLLRKLWLKGQTDSRLVTERGYKPPGKAANSILNLSAKMEPVPQRLVGTSVMAIYRKE